MNTQAIQQLLDTASTMFEHALKTYREMRVLEARANESESEEDKKRRRRLRALRWMIVTASLYAGYRVVKLAFKKRRHGQPIADSNQQPGVNSRYGALPSSYSYGGQGQQNWHL